MPRSRSFRVVVRASPEAVRRHLDSQTHLRLLPAMGRSFARSSKPLAGRVADDGSFRVADSSPDWWRRTRPVAVGKVAEHPEGAVVEGVVGFPTWLTWYFRVVWLALAAGALGTTAMVLAGAAPALASAAPVLLVGVVIAALSIGLHVGNSDAKVDALVERLGRVVASGGERAAEPVGDAAVAVRRVGAPEGAR